MRKSIKNWYQTFILINGRTPIQFWNGLLLIWLKKGLLIYSTKHNELQLSINENILTMPSCLKNCILPLRITTLIIVENPYCFGWMKFGKRNQWKTSLMLSWQFWWCRNMWTYRTYIQSNLENILPKINFGLYRDDGLIFLRNLNGHQMDKKRKTIGKLFKDIGFNTDIPINLKEVDFSMLYWTYKIAPITCRKNPLISYFNPLIMEPSTAIIKHFLNFICHRLLKNFSSQEVFNIAKVEYEDALKKGNKPTINQKNQKHGSEI